MNIDKLFSNLLLFCIPLYFSQGWLFDSGSIISQMLVGVWLLIDFYYLVRYFSISQRSSLANAIFLFWIVLLLYWFFSPRIVYSSYSVIETFGDLKNATVFSLSLFPFYYWKVRGVITEKYFRFFSIFFIFSAIVAFNIKNTELIGAYDMALTNNTAYYFVMVIPFISYWGLRKSFYLFYILIVYFVLLCAKRGAIVCVALSILVFLVISLRDKSSKKRRLQISWVILGLGVIVALAILTYSSSELLQLRMEDTREGNSSNRDYLYTALWQAYTSGSIINKLFGYGMSQTISFADGYAHSDWLELLINEGVVGVFLFASIFICGIFLYKRYRKYMTVQAKFTFLTGLSCLLVRSIFSMGYMAPETSLLCISLAVSLPINNSKSNDLCQVS